VTAQVFSQRLYLHAVVLNGLICVHLRVCNRNASLGIITCDRRLSLVLENLCLDDIYDSLSAYRRVLEVSQS
jgi:hypothetical protein